MAGAKVAALFTLISRIAGFARDLIITDVFGATRTADVFFIAFSIPNVLRRLVAEGALTGVFVPIYKEQQHESDAAAARFFAASLGLVMVSVALLTVVCIWGAPALVYAFASGFSDEPAAFVLAVDLTRLLFPYVYMVSLVALAMGVLNSHQHFAAPAAAPILLNVAMISCTLLIRDQFDQPITALAVGVLIGGVLQVLLQLPPLIRRGLLVWPSLRWRTEPIKRLLVRLVPGVLALGVYQFNVLILRNVASHFPAGHITYYYNADRLQQFAFGVFAVAISNAALPTMSSHAARGDTQKLLDVWRYSTRLTNFVTIPAALGLIGIAMPIVSVSYLHGRFTLADVELTALTLMAFAPGLIANGAARAMNQVFLARGENWVPFLGSCITVASVLGLSLALQRWQVVGLGGALTLSSFIQLIALAIFLRLRLGRLGLSRVIAVGIAQLALAAAAVGAAYGVSQLGLWEQGPTLRNIVVLGGAVGTAVAIYGGGAVTLGFEEAKAATEKLRGRLKR